MLSEASLWILKVSVVYLLDSGPVIAKKKKKKAHYVALCIHVRMFGSYYWEIKFLRNI